MTAVGTSDGGEHLPTYRIADCSKTLPDLIRWAQIRLEDLFGVTNLSLIERAHLRHCVIRCAKSIELHWAMWEQRKVLRRTNIASVSTEAAFLWMHEVYGIDAPYCLADFEHTGGCASRLLSEWLRLERARSHLL